MPSKLPKHPAYILRNLLRHNWNPTATSGLDPDIDPAEPTGLSMNRGWFNSIRHPVHVAIRSTSGEDVLDGGDSGYSGFDPSGEGGTQTRMGDLDVTVFAEGDSEYGTDNLDADDMRDAIREEIEDIVMAAQGQGDRDVSMPDAWESLSSRWDGDPNDTDVSPTVFISAISVTYSWERWP